MRAYGGRASLWRLIVRNFALHVGIFGNLQVHLWKNLWRNDALNMNFLTCQDEFWQKLLNLRHIFYIFSLTVWVTSLDCEVRLK